MAETIRPYEPLTSDNAAVILIDHQVGLMTPRADSPSAEVHFIARHRSQSIYLSASIGL